MLELYENPYMYKTKEVAIEPSLLDKQAGNPLFQIFSPPEKPRTKKEPTMVLIGDKLIAHPRVMQKFREAADKLKGLETMIGYSYANDSYRNFVPVSPKETKDDRKEFKSGLHFFTKHYPIVDEKVES